MGCPLQLEHELVLCLRVRSPRSCTTYAAPFIFSDHLLRDHRGQEYFVHPLDLTLPVSGPIAGPGSQNVTACINTFQYLTLDPTEFFGFDLILGDAFLRNVYAS